MTEFSRLTRDQDEKAGAASSKKAAKEPKPASPSEQEPKPPLQPAGERSGKRQSALAENLKKWLKGRTE